MITKIRFGLFFLSLLFATSISAQDYITLDDLNKRSRATFDEAKRVFYRGNNSLAIETLKNLLDKHSNLIDGHLLMAEIYQSDLSRNDQLKMQFLSDAIELDSLYNPAALFHLGESLIKAGRYVEGKDCIKALKKAQRYSTRYKTDIDAQIAKADFALSRMEEALDINITGIDALNTDQPETFPSLSAKGDQIFFGRVVQNQEDIFCSKGGGEHWSNPERLSFCTGQNETTQSISSDGKMIVFSACQRNDAIGSCDLYWSQKIGGQWTEPENMGPEINSAAWESQPCLAEDGRTLFFSSSRQGGYGAKDLYYSTYMNGKWSVPKNLGPKVNTKGDEGAPFLHFSGKELYFMSNGHQGMGERDIYLARRNLGEWDQVIHLPPPINSHLEEASLITNIEGTRAYYSRDKGTGNGDYRDMDLFQFELPEAYRPTPSVYLSGKVFTVDNEPLGGTKIKIYDLKTNYEKILTTEKDGSFFLSVAGDQDYGILVEKEGYLMHSDRFYVQKDSLEQEYIQEMIIRLEALKRASFGSKSKETVLNNVFFDTGSSMLDPRSKKELEVLFEFLERETTIKIEIQGHTDDVGSEVDNLKLSQNRAEAVRQYLIEQGIEESRITAKGYGESQFIADNATAKGRAKNRRTSFVLR